MTRIVTGIAAALLCLASSANAATTLTAKEKSMLQQDARGGAYEIALSQMALKKSGNAQIKAFAQTDIDDHAKLVEEAKVIAGEANVTLTATPSKDDHDKLDRIGKQSGKAFDEAFVQAMKAVNEEDKGSFKKNEAVSKSESVKTYLKHSAGTDQKHDALVQAIKVSP